MRIMHLFGAGNTLALAGVFFVGGYVLGQMVLHHRFHPTITSAREGGIRSGNANPQDEEFDSYSPQMV